jgi:hypothetical protein
MATNFPNEQKKQILIKKERNIQLPVEVLTQVISLATRMHEQDEFYDQASAFSSTEPSRFLTEPDLSLSARNEERNVFKDRLSFIQVCKVWYQVAIRFLWSNLKIKILPDLRECVQIIEIFERNPEFESFVRRVQLDAVWEELSSDETDNRTSCIIINKVRETIGSRLYPRLKRVRVLFAPQVFATGQHTIAPDAVFLLPGGLPPSNRLDSHYSYTYDWEGGAHFWSNVQFLDLDLANATLSNSANSSSWTMVHFPQLIGLRVRSCDDSAILEDIEKHWRAPALQSLSLHFEHTELWSILVRWAKESLITLHLRTDEIPYEDPIHLSGLKTLIIQGCVAYDWAEFLIAPNVETLIFEDHHLNFFVNGGAFVPFFTTMIGHYPLCSKVAYYKAKDLSPVDEDAPTTSREMERLFEFDPSDPLDRDMAVHQGWLR